MDTPALTPETISVASSLASPSPPAPLQTKPTRTKSPPFTMAFNTSGFFSKSKNAPPLSPHFDIPTRGTRRDSVSPRKDKPQREPSPRARKMQEDNPYFPSIADQERAERWKRDAAWLPQPSPPLAAQESTPPTDEEELSGLKLAPREDEDAAARLNDLSLSPMERRRTMRITLPVWDKMPAGAEARGCSESMPPESAEAYRRGMKSHLEEVIQRRKKLGR
ncbi:hypothetical protein BU23DRAFT_129916 [Bimuria novae-zelandiae CBS 107.79]|uniref:Uncharacterized protein n=1 Tax=Bimuria novae-zelandiae CBS 107.79 TaxID=1447943 RepID=A0A6A5V8A5_9PLEO|nr:hypothetical protein BU23DRAFT_129916 [Bimuria novae-zelandiae CBS 107.79]